MTRFYIKPELWREGFEVWAQEKFNIDDVVKIRRWESVQMRVLGPADEGACEPEPAFRLQREEAQGLMDELWQAGLRPSEGSGSAGALAATQKHLEDMKRVAFHVLNIK